MVEDREKRRKKILKAAERLFAKQGFHGTEVESIAKAAGVSKGSVYNYFKNKEDIFFSVVENGIEELNRKMREGMGKIQDSIGRLKRGIEIYVNHLEDNHALFKVLASEHIHLSTVKNRYYKDLFSRTVHLEKVISEGIQRGEIKKVDPYIAATCLNGMIDFLFYRGLVTGKKISAKEMAKEVSKIYMKGILA
jgi:TetR/AcrR family fatty acid metabolism transcriptional regulator